MKLPAPAPFGQTPRSLESLSAFDIVGLVFGVVGLGWSIVAALKVAPTFAKMFADFGQELPAFTRLCLSPWFPLVIGSIPLALLVVGVLSNASRKVRAMLVAVSILLTLGMVGIFLVGMYLPIFEIARAIE